MTNTPLYKFSNNADFVEWRKGSTCSGVLDIRFCSFSTLDFFAKVFKYWQAYPHKFDLRKECPNRYVSNGEGDFVDWLRQQNPPFEIEYIGPKMEPSNDPPGVVY